MIRKDLIKFMSRKINRKLARQTVDRRRCNEFEMCIRALTLLSINYLPREIPTCLSELNFERSGLQCPYLFAFLSKQRALDDNATQEVSLTIYGQQHVLQNEKVPLRLSHKYSYPKSIPHKIAESMRGEPRYTANKFSQIAQLAFTSLLIHKEKVNWF